MNQNITHCESPDGDFRVVFLMLHDQFLKQLVANHIEESLLFGCKSDLNPVYRLYEEGFQQENRFDKIYLDLLPFVSASEILDEFSGILASIEQETKNPSSGSFMRIKGLFSFFLEQLCNPKLYSVSRVHVNASSQDYLLSKVIQIIETSHGRCSRTDLENQLHYNSEYLNRILKKRTGKTISEYSQKIFLEEAARLLVQSDKTVSEIIESLGFSNHNYFYNLFSKYYGETPRQFRLHHI